MIMLSIDRSILSSFRTIKFLQFHEDKLFMVSIVRIFDDIVTMWDPPFLEVNQCSSNDKVLYGQISQNAHEIV